MKWWETVQPSCSGITGKVWLFDRAAIMRRDPDSKAFVSGALLYAPHAHPMWNWWMLQLIHLRAVPGIEAPTLKFAEATHEIFCIAINPDSNPPDPRDFLADRLDLLTPTDIVQQFHANSDADAATVFNTLLRDCTIGRLSPDQDYRAAWASLVPKVAEKVSSRRNA